jgi:hypothetical protein
MSFVGDIVKTFRQRKLWWLAPVLVAAIVAVPLLLSKNASSTPIAQVPASNVPAAGSDGVPVSVTTTPAHSRLPGKGRDPFIQQQLPAPKTPNTPTSTSTGATAGSTGTSGAGFGTTGSTGGGSTGTGSTGTGSTGSSSTGGTSPTGSGGNPPSITGGQKPKPVPPGLTSTEAYHVTLSITNASGGLDTIDPLQRLSVLPSRQQPLLVELGVLGGGNRVLFAVAPGTVVSGPGICTPGAIDCEVLSLAQEQTEQLSVRAASGATSVALFAVTAISVDHYSSSAAANHARNSASAIGRKLLANASLGALSLFQYDPSIGAVSDLRNLTVGGN